MAGEYEQQLEWSLGLRNYASGKYLTHEAFNFVVNANGATLKKKQTLYLQTSPTPGTVLIRTHLGRFLYALADGSFKGDKEQPDADCEWRIEAQVDGTWALLSRHNLYVHGSGDNLRCYQKEITSDAKWVVHLAMHPQVNIKNVMRKRFVHYINNELQCSEDIPWGQDSLLTLHFFGDHPEGRYGIIACTGEFLTASGKLVKAPTAECQFLLGFHDDQISLRDNAGNYLSCVGANGTLKVNKQKVTKDELFVLQDSEPQFTIRDSRGKQVSIRASVEVKADQPDVTDKERFQLELDAAGLASFKSSNSQYWSVGADGTVSSSAKAKGPAEKFTIIYNGPRVQFQSSSNGKVVTVKSNGALTANGNGSEETSQFVLTLDNRPEIVLRGQHGFVGVKGNSGRIEVNRSEGNVFTLECRDGTYALALNGRYWTVDSDGVSALSSSPVNFYLEFPVRSQCLIRHADSGRLLEGEQNGGFKATGSAANPNTLWEY